MFNEDYVTFPRDDIGKLAGVVMPVNKRNGRNQNKHMEVARAIQNVVNPNWREGNGRPSAKQIVIEWKQAHPEGKKVDCHRDTGLDPKTIRKWWNE